jgi:hypothetical protein
MTTIRTITSRDCPAPLVTVKPLRFAPTPFGAGGLDGLSVAPRVGIYVMVRGSVRTTRDTRARQGEEGGIHDHKHARC